MISKGHDVLNSPDGLLELKSFEKKIINALSKDRLLNLRQTCSSWSLINIKASSLNKQIPEGFEWLKSESNKNISVIIAANELTNHHGFVLTVTILRDSFSFVKFMKKIGQIEDGNSNSFAVKNNSKHDGVFTIGHLPTDQTPFYNQVFTNETWEKCYISFEIYRDLTEFEQSKKSILIEIFSLVFLSCLILWLLIYHLMTGITRPLKDLKTFSQSLEQGDLEASMPKIPVNEIGSLGKAFSIKCVTQCMKR